VADLQEIVDDLEAEIRRPISVEDRRWRLLAHSVQPAEADPVRRSSILTRETSPEVAAWLEGLGLKRARELVDLPANDELGMRRRGCLPIRHGDALLGFLWVIVGDRPLTPSEREAITRSGEEVARNLWERRRAADERRERTIAHLEALLQGRPGAARELADTLRWPETGGAYAIAVTDVDPDRLRRRRGDLAWTGTTILARDPAKLAESLEQAGATGGVSATFADLAQAPEALNQAKIAALCAPALNQRVATYDRLGSWALVATLWDGAGRPEPPPPITQLAAHRRAQPLLDALEGLLEHGGDVAAAAAALSMHRATLYRRLERVEEITGLDLANGDDRLLAHIGLRILKLATAVASTRD